MAIKRSKSGRSMGKMPNMASIRQLLSFRNSHTARTLTIPADYLMDDRIAEEARLLAVTGTESINANGKDDVLEVTGTALNLFPVTSPLRLFAFQFITSPFFENIIMVFILASGVRPPELLAAFPVPFAAVPSTDPLAVACKRFQVLLAVQASFITPPPGFVAACQVADVIFNFVFLLEFILKVIALGWYSTGRSAYIRNAWNVTDFVLLVGSIIGTVCWYGEVPRRGA